MDVDRPPIKQTWISKNMLQWSHVLMDVDSYERVVPSSRGCSASMEPRPDGRG